jgi:hypothetical protein
MTEQNEILTKEYWVKYLELATKGGLTDFAIAQDIVNGIEKAITVTRCSTQLKVKDRIAFHVFAEINKYTKCFEGYKRDGKTFSETEVLKRYNTYLQSL